MKVLVGSRGSSLSQQKTNRRLNLATSNVFVKSVLASAMLVAFSASSFAKDENLEKISAMKNTDTAIDIPTVPQTGKNVDQLKANLKKIKLPEGFKIELYAVVPDARYMAVAPSTNMLFVGTRKTTVWAVTDRNGDMTADEVKPFAPSIKFKNPNGVCWTKDGFLIVTESNRVLNFPAAEYFYEGPDVAVITAVKEGGLIPVEEQSYNHTGRVCRVADDGKLYVTLGQPYNVQPKDKIDLYNKVGIGGVIRLNPFDGSGKEVYAMGMRNPAGIDINPKDKTIWTTDNQVDGLGDDVPPGELNRITKAGQHFGFPYWNGKYKVAGSPAAPELKDMVEPANAVFPQVEFPAHQAQLGMSFYTGKSFPKKYQGGIFVASHGSWNRTEPSGYLINFVPLKDDGTAGKAEIFAEGFLDKETKRAIGRPVDVANMPDGSILVSDDYAGAIYRITYSAN
jgi:glucose/arabinose dehydrogenase